jgi:ferrous iron transport protein A
MPDDTITLPCTGLTTSASRRHDHTLTGIDLPVGTRARVRGIRPGTEHDSRELALRLLEIGFVEGEPVRVVAHGHPGREPVAVRIGGTMFALRRFEAERVLVEIEPDLPTAARPRCSTS